MLPSGKSLGGEPKRVYLWKFRSRDAVSPEHRVGDDRADLRPFAHRDLRRSRRKRAAGVGNETTQVDVELILAPDNRRVSDKRDRVVLRRLSVRALEDRARAPRSVEIVRRLSRLQERVLDSNDLSRRGKDRLI